MRISDWSSDVCSSDLRDRLESGRRRARRTQAGRLGSRRAGSPFVAQALAPNRRDARLSDPATPRLRTPNRPMPLSRDQKAEAEAQSGETQPTRRATVPAHEEHLYRTEEHTTEILSLMRT